MHQLPSPFPPLTTVRRAHHPSASDTSSPPSSRTTSPPSSPTSFRRHHLAQTSPHHLFNLSFHPHPHQTSHPRNEDLDSDPGAGNVYDGPSNPTPHCGVSILPCAVLRGRSSLMVVRRRPSAVDMALSEERSRCDGDAIERQGLDLMEPRPVDMNMHASLATPGMNLDAASPSTPPSKARASFSAGSRGVVVQQPRFVMGGIFEVMEGRA
ncbi:uncharacterized protein N7459_007000 [Penicillium hispanicum]|uniref:uncharacterized protein n=1 Tax=Penicillium hispanicum TaxID=1080232 RepID=UPI00254029A7|nr:uncharacterized protein N7459_007000 [Penicillium hispanicum]KAJ5578036.1 hypothetical protein N7459_007000 [Penicillium hispanicum]